jgi:hypothetical protein
MNIWIRFWIYWALLTFGFWLYYPAHGQTISGSTPNLINPAGTAWGIPNNQVLNAAGIGAIESGGPATGSAYYNSDTNTIRFSYMPSTVTQSIAINAALAGTGTGIKWLGYDYAWSIMNGGQASGPLRADIYLKSNNAVLETWTHNYAAGSQPAGVFQLYSGRQLFSQSGGYTSGQLASLDMSWTGQDSLFWMGLYGPRVRDTNVRLLYGVDQCVANPLSDPKCPGYAAAYLQQQCTANPLADPSCPGYAAAYLTQQCTANPLYNATCPGYQQAFVLQQQQSQQTTAAASTSTTSVSVTGTVSTTEPTITIATDGSVTTGVATVPQAEVNAVVTRQIPSTASPTGTVTLQVQTKPQEESEEERRRRLRAATDAEREIAMKEEKKREEEASERRKELAARMRAAAQEAAIGRGREAIRDANRAETMEQQMANQALIVATMNFVPGFESYGVTRLPDAQFYRPRDIYPGQQPVDNRRLLRGLTGASDQRHADMVDSQYGR